jgi:hypothetical protein
MDDLDSWTTYDAFAGPELDSDLWEPLNIGSPRVEPDARTTVADGTITVDIPRFTNGDPDKQLLDNTKHVIHSTRSFDLPAAGVARFGVDLAVDHVGDGSGDYRRGIAGFNVLDSTGETNLVFDILATGSLLFAEHEVLALPGETDPFTRVVHDPFLPMDGSQGDFRFCCIEFELAAGRVTWTADGRVLHEARGLTVLPRSVGIGFGFFTLLPVSLGEASCQGQGGHASWRNFRSEVRKP